MFSLKIKEMSKGVCSTTLMHTNLGPVYTNRHRQHWDNSVMMLVILFSLKTMGSLENELQLHSGVTPLISMRTESLASSQSCCSIDTDAWCKRAHRLESSITMSLHLRTGLQSAYHGRETL